METEAIRLRLVFEDRSVLNETQLSDGMNQSWLLIEPNKHEKISDVCNHLLHIFDLSRSCPNGILLYMEGFVLPPSESTRILKDKEILCVKRKELALAEAIEGADAGNLLGYAEVNRKEPVNNGMLLLANEEFDKETGGYQIESEEEKLEDEPSPITTSKKRKASTKSRSSKKKKHRSVMDGVEFENQVATEDGNINDDDERCSMKIISKKNKLNKEKGNDETKVKSSPKVKRKKKHHLGVVSGGEGEAVRHEICNIENDELPTRETIKTKNKSNKDTNKGDADVSDKKVKSPSNEKRSEHLQDDVQGVEQTSTALDWVKKGPSRSARRKKAKRQWKRELAIISQKPDTHLEPEVSKAKHKEANGHPKGHDHMPTKPVIEEEKRKCNGNTDTELVACVVKPGHIRFEPLEEGEDAMQIEVAEVGFEWNGISSKRKGQKWGIEKYSTPRRDEFEKASKEVLNVVDTQEVVVVPPVVDLNDFDKLPICTSPKEGDVIAYRLVELSSSWTPELSSYRVGKISHFDADNIVLNPVPEYPIVLDKMDEDDGPDNNSLYKEDGTLEMKFAGLVDVRIVKQSNLEPPVDDERDGRSKLMSSSNGNGNGNGNNILITPPDIVARNKEGGNNINNTWDEVMEALNAKKSELLEATNQEMNKGGPQWNRWSYRALRSSALGPTMALLRSNNNI